jgi:hypothetical protein
MGRRECRYKGSRVCRNSVTRWPHTGKKEENLGPSRHPPSGDTVATVTLATASASSALCLTVVGGNRRHNSCNCRGGQRWGSLLFTPALQGWRRRRDPSVAVVEAGVGCGVGPPGRAPMARLAIKWLDLVFGARGSAGSGGWRRAGKIWSAWSC